MPRYSKTIDQAAFWKQAGPPGCWEWQGARDRDGYGQTRVGQKRIKAHRRAWEIAHGAPPSGLYVLHRCDNTACVRPDHLYLGTALDNGIDRRARQRPHRRNYRLSRADANDIRTRYATKTVSQRQLAEEYGVDQTSISRITLGKSYRFDVKPRSNAKRGSQR